MTQRAAAQAVATPSPRAAGRLAVNWSFVLRTALILGCFLTFSGARILYSVAPENLPRLWVDAHVYYEATAAWVAGGNPWDATFFGVPFAAPPPALLLNLPLLPLGENGAVAVSVIANAVAAVYIVRRLALPAYWLLWFPFVEGFCGGSPDLTLAGLALWRGAWLAALAKPYAAPAIAAVGRWRSLAIAALVAVATVPLLPWAAFFAAQHKIGFAFDAYTTLPGAWGEPVLMAAVVVALLSLRRRDALELATPGLIAQQPHYLIFSLETISRSTILTIASTLPIRHLMAAGVVLYAGALAIPGAARRRRGAGDQDLLK